MTSRKLEKEKREKKVTLAVVLEALVGSHVVVELKNNVELCGTLTSVHARSMDMILADVIQTRPLRDGVGVDERRLEIAHVVGRMVRYVHIPDEISIDRMLQQQVSRQRVSLQRSTKHKIRDTGRNNAIATTNLTSGT